MTSNDLNSIFERKQQFHKNKTNIFFEEKVKEIIEMQKIDIEFSKHRKTPRAPFIESVEG